MTDKAEDFHAADAPDDLKNRHMESYDAIVDEYNAWTAQHHHIRLSNLAELSTQVPQLLKSDGPVRVLELGCGSAKPVLEKLLADNPNITAAANELSPKQMDLARENLAPYSPRVEFLPGDMTALSFPPDSFDAILGLYTLIHLTQDEQVLMVKRINTWLRPGGCLLANFSEKEAAGVAHEAWLGKGGWVWFSGKGVDGTIKMVDDSGLEVVKAKVEGDEQESFLWVIAKKKESS